MQLVGATRSYILRPFVIKGITNGLAGAFIAYPTFNEIKTINQPPQYATEIPSYQPLADQTKIIMNFAMRITGGALLVLIISFIF